MRSLTLIVTLMLAIAINARDKLPVIKSTVSVISIQDCEVLKEFSRGLSKNN